jgi:hypothetical protein
MLKAVETIEAVKGCRRAGYSSYYNAKNRGFLFTIYREREREREELRAAVPIHICQPVQYTPPLLFSLALMNITPPPFSLSLQCAGAPVVPPPRTYVPLPPPLPTSIHARHPQYPPPLFVGIVSPRRPPSCESLLKLLPKIMV